MSEDKNRTAVSDGMFVAFTYKVVDAADGALLFEVPAKAPDTMVYGVTEGVVPGLCAALRGLRAGDRFEVSLPPEAAFGQISEDWVKRLPRSIFSPDGSLPGEVKEGAMLPMMTDQGVTIHGKVGEITPEEVVMDFNHPFAGKTVTFTGEVLEVRPATAEELNPPKCGCCHGGCGDDGCGSDGCGDGGCSDGCCSEGHGH